MSERRYRISHDIIGDGDCIEVDEPCEAPDFPASPKAEYRCNTIGCPLRVVTIKAENLKGKLPALLCPACGTPLTFVSFLREDRLVPADTPKVETVEAVFREIGKWSENQSVSRPGQTGPVEKSD